MNQEQVTGDCFNRATNHRLVNAHLSGQHIRWLFIWPLLNFKH